MSRIGKQPIQIPDKVKITINDGFVLAEGPLGKERVLINANTKVNVVDKEMRIECLSDNQNAHAAHGLMKALLANAVTGVSTGFKKLLEINGIGYKAEVKGKTLKLNLGFSHAIDLPIPDGIKIDVPEQTKMVVSGSNKELIGRVASEIRKLRPPEPYKGKGIKYAGEKILRKVGKAAGGK